MGSDWNYSQEVNVTIAGFRDDASTPNTMSNDVYSYAIRSTSPTALAITTTTLPSGTTTTAYSQTLEATGGTSPYVWSLLSGTLPTGLTLTSGGVLSGTPSVAGTYDFTVKVLDNVSATDNQALSVLINQIGSGGTTTISGFQDSFINLYSVGTNYSGQTFTEVYVYPANTPSNRILDNISLSSIPANATITNATLRKYYLQPDGGAGSDPMRLYVYPVTGMPTISTATWTSFDASATMGADESYVDVNTTPGWKEWNVTNMTQNAYIASTNVSIAVDSGPGSISGSSRQFASSDYVADTNLRPQLVVTYTIGTGTDPTPSISAPGKMRVSKMKGVFR
jgi:hypothetical protein